MNAQLATEIISNISMLSNASKESENYLMILSALLMENIKKYHNEMISNPSEYRKHTYVTLVETLQAELNQEKKIGSLPSISTKSHSEEEESISIDINDDLYEDNDIIQGGSFDNKHAIKLGDFSRKSGFRKKIIDAFVNFLQKAKQDEVPWYHDDAYVLKSIVFDEYRTFSEENFPEAPPVKHAGNFWKNINNRINIKEKTQMGSRYVYLRSRKNIRQKNM